MKPRRGRRILRKILEFFHLSAPCAPVIAPPLYTASSKITTTIDRSIDQPPQYSPGTDVEKANPHRRDLENHIVQLWKKVYLGLYEIDDSDQYQPRYRYDRLEALYLGTGLARPYKYVGELYVMRRRFNRYDPGGGMLALKLFDNTSCSTLQSVIRILEAYEKEVPNLVRLEKLLRKSQLALFPEQSDSSVGMDALRQEYEEIVKPMTRRIEWYDARMRVLNHDMLDEVMVLDNGQHRLKGQFVYHKAFPGRSTF